jgi:hypothetical protein
MLYHGRETTHLRTLSYLHRETDMLNSAGQIAIAIASVVTIFLAQASAQAPDSVPDAVATAWKSRSEAATKKLASAKLDKCDMGLEVAFQEAAETTSGKQRSYGLHVTIDGQTMVVSYTYVGQRLNAFMLVELPPEWLAVQKAESKALNVLVQNSNCTFDLCTNDPFSTGLCTGHP